MTIHHSTRKRAEGLGIIMTETTQPEFPAKQYPSADFAANVVSAFWGKHNVYAFGAGEKPAAAALAGAEALQAIKDKFPTCVILNDSTDPFLVRVFTDDRNMTLDREPMTPIDAWEVAKGDKQWTPTTVPLDGGEAHKAGFFADDNPYDEDEDNEDFVAWDEAWEASADEADAADAAEDEDRGGSVVSSKYRELYREQGHPNHCGDWLAVTLNNLVQGKTVTDLERFEAICAVNNVDTSKYKREGNGWQGRIRMTGRNLLAKQVYLQEGKLKLPEGMFPDMPGPLLAPGDWMTGQRFKMPKGTAAPAVTPTTEAPEQGDDDEGPDLKRAEGK